MSDLISRQSAIEAVREAQEWFGAKETSEDCFAFEACEEIIDAINKIPSAERKRGEWIEDGYNHYKAVCSECGEPCGTYVMDKPRDNFCKWCGADMRGGDNEID